MLRIYICTRYQYKGENKLSNQKLSILKSTDRSSEKQILLLLTDTQTDSANIIRIEYSAE